MLETFLILGLLAASHAADTEPTASAGPGLACEYRLAATPAAQQEGWVEVTDPAEIFSMRAFARGEALRKKCEPAARSAAVPAPAPQKIDWDAVRGYTAAAVGGALMSQFAAATIGGPIAAMVGGWLGAGLVAGELGTAPMMPPTAVANASGVGAGLSAATGGSPALGAVLGVAALAAGWEVSK
jgi:hypothetical protein